MTKADPLIIRIPDSVPLSQRKFFRYLIKLVYDLRARTGNSGDFIEDISSEVDSASIGALFGSLDARISELESTLIESSAREAHLQQRIDELELCL